MVKVLIPIGDAAEAMDTLYPFFRIREEGYQAVVAGPEKRVYPLVMHEIPPGWDITRESPSYHLAAEVAFRDVNPEEFDAMFLTGGRAPEYLRYDQNLMRIVRHFFDSGKPVAVVCHGIEIVAAEGQGTVVEEIYAAEPAASEFREGLVEVNVEGYADA